MEQAEQQVEAAAAAVAAGQAVAAVLMAQQVAAAAEQVEVETALAGVQQMQQQVAGLNPLPAVAALKLSAWAQLLPAGALATLLPCLTRCTIDTCFTSLPNLVRALAGHQHLQRLEVDAYDALEDIWQPCLQALQQLSEAPTCSRQPWPAVASFGALQHAGG